MKQLENEKYSDYYYRLLQKAIDIVENDINSYEYEMVKTLLRYIPSEILEEYVNDGAVSEPYYIK
jgi:hypothetical protein